MSQLRFRRSRTLTLGLGILVAAVSFTLLTSAVRTSTLAVQGSVARNWKAAYDILVRPPDSFTKIERQQGLVRDNYLSGVFGGITFRQYRDVLAIPGVEVAAPIANVGYIAPYAAITILINDVLTDEPIQLYRLKSTWLAERGLSHYPGHTRYVYYTRVRPLTQGNYGPREVTPGQEESIDVCGGFNGHVASAEPASPLDTAERSSSFLECFSSRSPEAAELNVAPLPAGSVGTITDGQFPIMVAAIDPVQENRLLNLNGTLLSGRMLRPGEAATLEPSTEGDLDVRTVPVIAATRVYVDQSLQVQVERLQPPPGADVPKILGSDRAFRFLTRLPGGDVGTKRFDPDPIYEELLDRFATDPNPNLNGYWTASTVEYQSVGPDRLTPLPKRNPPSVWENPSVGGLTVNAANADVHFRRLESHPAINALIIQGGQAPLPALRVVGRFDPAKLPGFNPLSRVPLETYYPPQVMPADAGTRLALGERPLLPTMNLGGYIAQPPLILTTLEAARVLFDSEKFQGANTRAPISVIRVRVAGATGPDQVSRERIRRVATSIHNRTGLAVDITAGSSPRPLVVHLPAGEFGRPPLTLEEGWVKKGVAVELLTAIDRKSLGLFILVLVASSLFMANGAFASVRARRSEIGTLLCIGWSQGRIFRAILGELALIGLLSGLLGAGLAAVLILILSLDMPLLYALAVAPVAVAVAAAAGLVPAWRAARTKPVDAVRPVASVRGGGRAIRGIARLAGANLLRVPGRTLLGAISLFIGIAALTLLLSINLAFHGTVVGTLLGAFVSVQIRGVDYLGVIFIVVLGGLSVADVLFLNLRDRASELVTLRSSGWQETHLVRLVALEGLGIGLLGSLVGAGLGLALALMVGGSVEKVLQGALLSSLAGVIVALVASLIPAGLIGRLTPHTVLAEE